MRRSLGGLLLLVAGGLFALAISMFWLDRVAFSPSADTSTAFAILGDEEIRRQVATVVASADGPELGMSPTELREFIEQIARLRAGASVMSGFVADAHAHLIGEYDEQVTISAAEQVEIVRNERVALMPPITVPVQRISALAVISSVAGWVWVISLGLAVIATLLGFFVRPERGEFAFAFGIGCIATGVLLLLFGYVVPVALLPALSDDPWAGVFPRLANKNLTITLVAAIVFAVIGAVAILATSGSRSRRQRSTPLAVGRYREQHRWSR